MARAARAPGYLERLIAGAGGATAAPAVRSPYRRAWGPSAGVAADRRRAPESPPPSPPAPNESPPSRSARSRTDPTPPPPSATARPPSLPAPVARPVPGERLDNRQARAEPSADATPVAPAATARVEPNLPRAQRSRIEAGPRPVMTPRRPPADEPAPASSPVRRPATPAPPADDRRRATVVTATAPSQAPAPTSAPRGGRRAEPAHGVGSAMPAQVVTPTLAARPIPPKRTGDRTDRRPTVQIGSVDVHVAAPQAPASPAPVAAIPSGPLSRPPRVFGLAQG